MSDHILCPKCFCARTVPPGGMSGHPCLCPKDEPEDLDGLRREITRLRALVKEAYDEGVSDGSCSGSVDVETRWNHSESKRKSEGEG